MPKAKELISTKQVEPPAEFAPCLGETTMIPIRGRLTELAAGIKLPKGEPLRAGRKIYDYLVDTMVYNYLAKGAGSGDALWTCDSKTGDCTDYHSVFIGACRWRGIPADHVYRHAHSTGQTGGRDQILSLLGSFLGGRHWLDSD